MDVFGKALILATDAEIQEAEFRINNQELLTKQLRKLQAESTTEDVSKVDDLIGRAIEVAAKSRGHKQICEMMKELLEKTQS